jgi:hypothetical protein
MPAGRHLVRGRQCGQRAPSRKTPAGRTQTFLISPMSAVSDDFASPNNMLVRLS